MGRTVSDLATDPRVRQARALTLEIRAAGDHVTALSHRRCAVLAALADDYPTAHVAAAVGLSRPVTIRLVAAAGHQDPDELAAVPTRKDHPA